MLKRSRIYRVAVTPAFGLLLAGIFSFGAGATASADTMDVQAHPSGCEFKIQDAWRTMAKCSESNGGHYRAIAVCKDSEGRVTNAVGAWKNNSTPSYAYCSGSGKPTAAGVETKYN
ncbi:hypothetical protein C6Y14_37865 [Streptomyces dioscori]|uniref:Uncharacterized protein n=1 Tax=Streptomyces dioscori TaxID=2109333 RepID=A0A2P8PVT8_9ACTN|nr:hypothetical protein C6Y14_37865 [Streptomyces dioscori]